MIIAWKPKSTNADVASVRYRCMLPMEGLKRRGVSVEIFTVEHEDKYAAVIFSKLYDAKNQEIAERLKRKGIVVILDVCDNHFYNPYSIVEYERAAQDLRRMTSLADVVVCSTEKLAEIFRTEINLVRRPIVIGDPVERLPAVADVKPGIKSAIKRMFLTQIGKSRLPVLLWYGSHGSPNAPSGMLDLLKIANLLETKSRVQPFELLIVSNNEEKYKKHIATLPFPTRYMTWERNSFAGILKSAAGVIIPVNHNPFTLCKTNNRLATALYYGVPVIADIIPSYIEFGPYAFLDKWEEGLETVLWKPAQARKMAASGRDYILEHCMLDNIVPLWERVLRAHVSALERC